MVWSKCQWLPLFVRALKTTILLLFLVYLVIFAQNVRGWLNPALLAAFVMMWTAFGRWRTGLELPVLVFASILALTSFFSIDPRRSFEQVWLISIGLCILLMIPLLLQWGISAGRIAALVLLIGAMVMA